MQVRGFLTALPAMLSIVTACFCLAGCNPGGTSGKGPTDGARAMRYVKAMVDLGTRPAGSPSLLACKNQIKAHLESLGLKTYEQQWWEMDSVQKKKVRMHNIWTQIPGDDPIHGPILMLCAHYDTKLCSGHDESDGEKRNIDFVGAIDGGGASGLLMELATHLKDRNNGPNIWILWVDGEESIPWQWKTDNSECLHGSRHFVKVMSKDKTNFPKGLAHRIKAFVLLDLIGSKNIKIDRDKSSNRALSDIFLEAAKKMGEEKRMFQTASEMTDDHLPFRNQGVKVIDLIDFHFRVPGGSRDPAYEAWWHTEQDNLEAMDAASLTFAGNLVWNALPILEEKIFKMKPKDNK
jgi:glutaminyl-peptide cyclotransferase